MRIVVCNKYYFLNGGTERYIQNIMHEFSAAGHSVYPFSVAYAGSWESPYSKFFLKAPGDPREIYLNQIHLTPRSLPTLLGRAVYSFEARRKLKTLIDNVCGVDAAYLLNIYNYMSPSIIHTLAQAGVRIVMRLGDYNLMCSNYQLYRDGKPCSLCVHGNHSNAVRYRCVHGSLGASAVRAFSLYVHRLLGIYKHVHAFVAPGTYMRDRLVEAGLPADRVAVLRQPAVAALAAKNHRAKTDTIVSFGRLVPEKGLALLVKAFQQADLQAELVIVGRSYEGYREYLEGLVQERFRKTIRFVEFLETEPLSRLVAEARLTVVPSLHPDNAPQSIVESYLNGTPVLGAATGAIPELIDEGVTGATFAVGSAEDLACKLKELWADKERLRQMGENALQYSKTRSTMSNHLLALTALFEGAAPRDVSA